MPSPSPDDLRRAATRLRSEAATLDAALRPVAAHGGAEVWRGRAADRFRSELGEARRRLADCAVDLEALASELVAEAGRIEVEVERQAALQAAAMLAPLAALGIEG